MMFNPNTNILPERENKFGYWEKGKENINLMGDMESFDWEMYYYSRPHLELFKKKKRWNR